MAHRPGHAIGRRRGQLRPSDLVSTSTLLNSLRLEFGGGAADIEARNAFNRRRVGLGRSSTVSGSGQSSFTPQQSPASPFILEGDVDRDLEPGQTSPFINPDFDFLTLGLGPGGFRKLPVNVHNIVNALRSRRSKNIKRQTARLREFSSRLSSFRGGRRSTTSRRNRFLRLNDEDNQLGQLGAL